MSQIPIRPLLAIGAGLLSVKLWWDASTRREALQRMFIAFHDGIKHEQFGERALLRERKELLLTDLRRMLPPELKVTAFDQGSYAMQTGVMPLDGDFDIDVGLIFECDKRSLGGPVEAKRLVCDALARGSRRVSIRRSCVTVQYMKDGRDDHHVDIAVYAHGQNDLLYLAKGKEHSQPDNCFWEPSDPETLTTLVRDKFSGAALSQFRRCVRYLKRWKHLHFRNRAPYSIALTMGAYQWFSPSVGGLLIEEPNDLQAMLDLARRMLQEFRGGRMQVLLPVSPGKDLLADMTGKQMRDFQEKLGVLASSLASAQAAEDIYRSNAVLREQFGSQFPTVS
jgi:cyclic GMP-AMP synthase DncV-like protein